MFIRHLINKSPTTTYDTRKCGGIDWGGIAGGASGLIGGLIGAAQARGNMHIAYARERALQKDQQEFNAAEAEKERQWSSDEWDRQFAKTNAYNTPLATRMRLEEAGLNPYMVMDDGTSGQVLSGPSTPSGSSASSAMGSAPLGQGSSVDWTRSLTAFADVAKSLAEARKAGAETSNLEAMYSGIAAESEFNSFIKSKDLSFVKSLDGKMSPQMQELLERINKIGSETARNESEAALATQKKETEAQITELQEEAKKLTKREREVYDKYADIVKEHGDTRYQRELAQIRKDNASAYRDEQGAVSDRMQAGAAVQNARTNEFVGFSHVRVNDDTREQIKKTVDLLKEQIKNAQNNNDWFTVTRLSEIVRNLLGAGASAAGAAAGFIK